MSTSVAWTCDMTWPGGRFSLNSSLYSCPKRKKKYTFKNTASLRNVGRRSMPPHQGFLTWVSEPLGVHKCVLGGPETEIPSKKSLVFIRPFGPLFNSIWNVLLAGAVEVLTLRSDQNLNSPKNVGKTKGSVVVLGAARRVRSDKKFWEPLH